MKKFILLFSMFIAFAGYGQYCATDQVQAQLEKQNPEIRQQRLAADARFLQRNVQEFLKANGATFENGKYTGKIYEIPVVIHVIESSAPVSNVNPKVSDAEIQAWIENTNKMYATTYGGKIAPEGSGPLGGTVIPFKLVLAKRSPQCSTTTGIVRYNGSTVPNYDQYGVQGSDTENGATSQAIKTLAPHWPESSYFNIYIVTTFSGNTTNYGLMGWCGYPSNPDPHYDSFMKVAAVKNNGDTTLAHEFGHGMGLIHTFEGADSSPDSPVTAADCPANNNCQTDNDKLCDTEPGASLLNVYPTPTNNDINPCTGQNYQGVQYNIMNYTNDKRKFTPGQRDRALAIFLDLRNNLTKSLGGTPLSGTTITVKAATCSPAKLLNDNNNYNIGPVKVELGDINNNSYGNYTGFSSPYIDYTKQSCFNGSISTDILQSASSQLKVSIATNPQYISAYIDWNNNGTFETNERISGNALQTPKDQTRTITFTPPATAVKNAYLRMRVIADWSDKGVCSDMEYGQAEDYAVRLVDKLLGTTDIKTEQLNIIYDRATNRLILKEKNENFRKYAIFDMSGREVQIGNAKKEISVKPSLPAGMYILSSEAGNIKFIK